MLLRRAVFRFCNTSVGLWRKKFLSSEYSRSVSLWVWFEVGHYADKSHAWFAVNAISGIVFICVGMLLGVVERVRPRVVRFEMQNKWRSAVMVE